jgi:hypothetical protein
MITEVGLYEKHKVFFWERDSGKKIECEKGWFGLIDKMCSKLELLHGDKKPRFDSIKQKSGVMVIKFVKSGDDAFDVRMGIVAFDYSQQSSVICEVCGGVGTMARSESGSRKTLCDKHIREIDHER